MLLLFLCQLLRKPASAENLPPTKDKVSKPGGGFAAHFGLLWLKVQVLMQRLKGELLTEMTLKGL